jgi:hypothetical protein
VCESQTCDNILIRKKWRKVGQRYFFKEVGQWLTYNNWENLSKKNWEDPFS